MIFTTTGIELTGGAKFTLEEITRRVTMMKISTNNLVLLTIEWGEERGFDGIKETLAGPSGKIDRLEKLLRGKEVVFGEIAGKHSDVYGDIAEKDMTIERDHEKVAEFLKDNPTGHKYYHSFLEKIVEESDQEDKEIIEIIKLYDGIDL